jgi:hypothetical protein
MPVSFMASRSSSSSLAISGSGFGCPEGRVRAFLASRAALSKGPPMPTPTVRGGLALGPALSIVWTTKRFMAGRPSAGVSILRALMLSQPAPLTSMVNFNRSPGTTS